ncbi:hypothetical protein GCM10010129_57760 [Streptomyces fumigatiscleroticus]|nr:hypothetical protein GCM10010129_57760 [Streptomyces fumigatiscleroticus]
MENEGPGADDEFGFDDEDDDGLPVLIDCDECGKVMEPGLFDGDDPLLSVVPDPAAVYPEAPERNGTRLVMVCSSACFDAIHQRFRPPPPEEERWAVAIARAVWDHPGEDLTPQRMREVTGLSAPQVSAGAEYLRKRLEGEEGPPGGETPK